MNLPGSGDRSRDRRDFADWLKDALAANLSLIATVLFLSLAIGSIVLAFLGVLKVG